MYRVLALVCAIYFISLVSGQATDAPQTPPPFNPEICFGGAQQTAKKTISERIIGGEDADWHKYPWIAKNVCMYEGTTVWVVCGCSSTIIHPFYTITAGHCLNGPYSYKVGLMFSDGEVLEVAQEIRHPDFSRDALKLKLVIGIVSNSHADIGLQRLPSPVGFSKGKQILDILLYKNSDLTKDIVGDKGKLLGWGATTQSEVFLPAPEGFSATLNQIHETVIENAFCQEILNIAACVVSEGELLQSPFQFDDTLLCASPFGYDVTIPTPVAKGLCNGDSGGPIFTTTGWLWEQHHALGFVTDTLSTSEATPCGNGIDIYTRLTPAYLDWVRSVVFSIPFNTK